MNKLLKQAQEEATQKAEDLSKQLGVKVHPIVFADENEKPVVGFIKEPSRAVKMGVLDKAMMGAFSAAGEMLDVCLIKEHSDARIYTESPENDAIYLGAVMEANALVKFSANTLKKK